MPASEVLPALVLMLVGLASVPSLVLPTVPRTALVDGQTVEAPHVVTLSGPVPCVGLGADVFTRRRGVPPFSRRSRALTPPAGRDPSRGGMAWPTSARACGGLGNAFDGAGDATPVGGGGDRQRHRARVGSRRAAGAPGTGPCWPAGQRAERWTASGEGGSCVADPCGCACGAGPCVGWAWRRRRAPRGLGRTSRGRPRMAPAVPRGTSATTSAAGDGARSPHRRSVQPQAQAARGRRRAGCGGGRYRPVCGDAARAQRRHKQSWPRRSNAPGALRCSASAPSVRTGAHGRARSREREREEEGEGREQRREGGGGRGSARRTRGRREEAR